MAAKQTGNRIVAQNRKAYHDYFVEDKYEAGISLAGTEVKSIRQGTINFSCSIGMNRPFSSKYDQSNQ